MSSNNLQESNIGGDSCASLSNTPASIVFVQSLQHQVNEHDINALIQSQKHMLARFEKTNEMLVNCNSLLTARQVGASKELKKHISFLVDLKKDLETIFRRIRFLKMKLSQQYGEAFSAAAAPSRVFNDLDEEEEEEKENSTPQMNEPSAASTANASSSGSRGSSPSSPSTSDTG